MPVRNASPKRPRKAPAKKSVAKKTTATTKTHVAATPDPPAETPPVVEAENRLITAPHTTTDIVLQVLRGEWGTGQERRRRLAEAGHNPNYVQAEIVRLANNK